METLELQTSIRFGTKHYLFVLVEVSFKIFANFVPCIILYLWQEMHYTYNLILTQIHEITVAVEKQ
jgi:hypothetical protein